MRTVQTLPVALRALHSEDIEATGKVEIRAVLLSGRRDDSALEQIIGRLSLESGVTAVSWAIVAQDAESELALDYGTSTGTSGVQLASRE